MNLLVLPIYLTLIASFIPSTTTTLSSNGGYSTTTFAYDSNGNLASTSAGLTNTWDYNNRLTQTTLGNTKTSYLYDHAGTRVRYSNGFSTTTYPSKYYDLTATSSTKHYFVGDQLIATVSNSAGATSTYYIHTDHLGSPTIVTNASSTITETTDYYPYGQTKIDTRTSGQNESRKYIGERVDQDTSLSYLNARYYDGQRGQFLSLDPVFLAVGGPKLTEIVNRVSANNKNIARDVGSMNDKQALQRFLMDPQLMNSYGYARDNPIINKDPTGEVIPLLPIIAIYGVAQTLVDLYEAKIVFYDYPGQFSSQDKKDVGFKLGLDALLPGTARAAKTGEKVVLNVGPVLLDVLDHYFGRQTYQNINYGNIQSQTSVQDRQSSVQSYNSSFGLSTGGGGKMPNNNSLWVTPSGAVVTFGGQLVAPPPVQSSKKP